MKKIILAGLLMLFMSNVSAQEGFIGEIRLFAGNFAPRNWAFCNGQTLPISQNNALYSILGTTYGGDGRTSYGLPDLRGRVPIGVGRSPGLIGVVQGQKSGSTYETVATQVNLIAPDSLGVKLQHRDVTIPAPKTLGLRYIICMQGIYPSRS